MAGCPSGLANLTTETARKTIENPAPDVHYYGPALLPENHIEDLKWLAAIAFRVMGCRDVAYIDFQLDSNDDDKPYIVNVNPLPRLDPDVSGLYLAAKANNWTYETLINLIVAETTERCLPKTASNQINIYTDRLITRQLLKLALV